MLTDVISAVVRALSFIALFQAAGIAIFIAIFGHRLDLASDAIRRAGLVSAIAGILFVSVHYGLEAARMAGALSGVVDLSLQRLVLKSSMSIGWGVRIVGLALIAATISRNGRICTSLSIGGAALAIAGFMFVGHTAVHADRAWLAVLLSLHLAVVAFWFGALVPLLLISRNETPIVAARIVDEFSRLASWWVPGIFLAGVLLTVILVDRWAVFGESYGAILLAKAAAFAVLMGLAALNRWRYRPTLAGAPRSTTSFQIIVTSEYVLICAVLSATAIMTTFFSPESSGNAKQVERVLDPKLPILEGGNVSTHLALRSDPPMAEADQPSAARRVRQKSMASAASTCHQSADSPEFSGGGCVSTYFPPLIIPRTRF
jgi:putative copper resistance protein D